MKALLLFFFSSVSLANWSSIPSKEFSLPEPPAQGSRAESRELQELHRLEANRSDEDCAVANRQLHPTFSAFFGGRGAILTSTEVAKAKPLLDRVTSFTERVAGYFKGRFGRPRPYTTDPSLQPCVDMPSGARSYPSSHAAIAMADACVLAHIFPAKADELVEAGTYYGDLRAIVGVHHRSDVKAGQDLGNAICERLLGESDFLEAVEAL